MLVYSLSIGQGFVFSLRLILYLSVVSRECWRIFLNWGKWARCVCILSARSYSSWLGFYSWKCSFFILDREIQIITYLCDLRCSIIWYLVLSKKNLGLPQAVVQLHISHLEHVIGISFNTSSIAWVKSLQVEFRNKVFPLFINSWGSTLFRFPQ